MKVVIIEDEKPAARRLTRMLEEQNTSVVKALHSVEEAVNWFNTNEHPELIFLDIQLSDGLSFEIFEHVNVQSNIIFTTAYDEYALKAFSLKSIDYLLKPIDEDDLAKAIVKYQSFAQTPAEHVNINIEQLKHILGNKEQKHYKSRFTIKVGQHLKLINTSDIVCFYSQNKASYLHTSDNRSYLIDYTLSELENILNPKAFFKINRGFFVHITSIKDIISYTNSRLELKLHNYDEEQVIVARESVKKFKNWLE